MLAFSADTRRADLQRMGESAVDVLVIGGGITGAGVALDAASRGLSVALVEREDFAAGTSGRSSRMIHGGVRYLEQREFEVVHESLRERHILVHLAAHLVRPIPMYVPSRSAGQRAAHRAGLVLYDALALGRNVGDSRLTSTEEIAHLVPGLAKPRPGVRYFECRTDDARLTVEVVRTAKRFGALVANHAEVEALLGEGRVTGARVRDTLGGGSVDVRARAVVNAAGVWASRVQRLASDHPSRLRPSKGVHLVFRPGAIDTRVGLTIPSAAHDHRWIFVIPWGDRVYAGTTDTAYAGDLDDPAVDELDRAYVVEAIRRQFPSVTEADVVAEWAGLRPLLARGDGSAAGSNGSEVAPRPDMVRTADLSRRHAIYEAPAGLFTITGGKLTAYRSMAKEMVDHVARSLGVRRRCVTRRIPLGYTGDVATDERRAAEAATALGLPPGSGARMVHRFGDDWGEALRLIRREPSLGEPVTDGLPVLGVEVELARSREMALTDDDVFVRRTRLSTMDARAVERSVWRDEAPSDVVRGAARPG